MNWLNYHHLFYFRTIAVEGTVAKAAAKLRLGQPTLSTQLKQLEAALGQTLFERRQKRLHLTEAGRVALNYANEIFRLGDEMVQTLGDGLSPGKVAVTIGALDAVPKHLVLRMIEQAKATHDCVVSIVEGRWDELIRELRGHRVDLAVANYQPPARESTGLYARKVAKMPVVICGARQFLQLRRDFPRSLEGQSFVMPTSDSRMRHDVEQALRELQIKVQISVEVQDTSLQKLLGIHGVGLIPIAAHAAEDLIKDNELFVLGELSDVHEELWLIAGDRRLQNPVAASLMKKFRL